jgi:hypothetical protein
LRPERMRSAEVGTECMRSAEVGTGGGSSPHDGASRGLRADEPPTWLAIRLATGLALEVAATRGAATTVPSPSDRRRASAIGSERERDIRGVREKKDEPLETRAELPSSIELGEGSLDVGALPPSTEPGEGWVEGALPRSMEWGEDGGMTRGGLPARLPCADVMPAGTRAPCWSR